MNRKEWYKWHSLAGIKLSILICFILITGTIAVVSHEIDWLVNKSQRAIPLPKTSEVNWSAVYNSALKEQPKDKISSLHAPINLWFAAEVIKIDKNKNRYRQFFHPQTGKYQGNGRWYNWQRFFRMTHRHLMMPTIYGTTIVCIAGLIMFFSLISGVIIYPKWWLGFFRKPRTYNPKVFWNDAHRLFGLWSSWLLLIVCFTGVWYLLEVWGLNARFPEQNEEVSVTARVTAVTPSERVFIKIIEQVNQYNDIEIKRILLPTGNNKFVIVEGQGEAILVRNRANNVIFDPVTATYLSHRVAGNQSFHVRISEAADPLHFGVFYGIYSKILYFIFGVILSSLAVSGTYLYGLRHIKTHRQILIVSNNVWKLSWQGMSLWKWLSVILISISFILSIFIFTGFVLI